MTMFSKINESTMETECLSSTSNSAKISPSAHPSNIPVPKGWKSSDQWDYDKKNYKTPPYGLW